MSQLSEIRRQAILAPVTPGFSLLEQLVAATPSTWPPAGVKVCPEHGPHRNHLVDCDECWARRQSPPCQAHSVAGKARTQTEQETETS